MKIAFEKITLNIDDKGGAVTAQLALVTNFGAMEMAFPVEESPLTRALVSAVCAQFGQPEPKGEPGTSPALS